jgi:hypothetical protein
MLRTARTVLPLKGCVPGMQQPCSLQRVCSPAATELYEAIYNGYGYVQQTSSDGDATR